MELPRRRQRRNEIGIRFAMAYAVTAGVNTAQFSCWLRCEQTEYGVAVFFCDDKKPVLEATKPTARARAPYQTLRR